MEHRTFGQIVTALRKEQIDLVSGHSWSQHRLADETGLTVRIGLWARSKEASRLGWTGKSWKDWLRTFNSHRLNAASSLPWPAR